MKEDTRVEGPWEYGEYKTLKNNKNAQKSLKECMEMTHEERKELTPHTYNALIRAENHYNLSMEPYTHDVMRGLWLWGEPGSGKSTMARAFKGTIYIKN